MARGTKTGGRDFKKGSPGRPKGAKDVVLRSTKASVVSMIAEYVLNHPDEVKAAIKRGLNGSSSVRFLELAADRLDGKPVQAVHIGGVPDADPIKVTFGGRYRPDEGDA